MIRCLAALFLAFALAACAGELESVQTPVPRTVRIDWYGHECFRIRSAAGTEILINPFHPRSMPHSLPRNLAPEILLVTNESAEVNYIDAVENTPRIFRGSAGIGSNSVAGTPIRGVATFRNPYSEDIQGMNVVFGWSMDGIRFCHLGNIENPLTPSQAASIGRVDVLFLPVGVPAGLSDVERSQIIAQSQPKVTIPMGEPTAIREWCAGKPRVHVLRGPRAQLSPDALPAEPRILVFSLP